LAVGTRGYDISGTGELSELAGSPFLYAPYGSSRTTAVEVTPDGRRVFALDFDLGFAAFDVGLAGELSLVPGSPRNVGATSSELKLTPDGAFLFVGTYDPAGISIYAVGAAGLPSPIGVPLTTEWIIGAIAPAGTDKLIALRRDTRDIAEYAIAGDGSLTPSADAVSVVDDQGRSPNGGAFVPCVPSYRDTDGDGYGDLAAPMTSCDGSVPTGYVDNSIDCNDANSAVYPGATEVCNGIDDNCDGTVDSGGSDLCGDDNDCTADFCDSSSGCLHHVADTDTSGFSAGRIDGRDLVVLANAWNSCPGDPAYNASADFDEGGCVDLTDFHLFMTTFGHVCP
jgi:hypothetical protein